MATTPNAPQTPPANIPERRPSAKESSSPAILHAARLRINSNLYGRTRTVGFGALRSPATNYLKHLQGLLVLQPEALSLEL